jgi:hypothetical protein
MIYDLSKNLNDFEKKITYFKENKSIIELKEKRKKRSVNQNSYMHVLFGLYGLHFGYTIDEVKTMIKRELKFYYKKKGFIFLKRTSEANSKELADFIEKFRNFSSLNGCYLPTANEYLINYAEIDNEIEKNYIYL